jgi:hypothetical protein
VATVRALRRARLVTTRPSTAPGNATVRVGDSGVGFASFRVLAQYQST